MRASIPYIEQKFKEYNQLIFGNHLPDIPIRLSRATTFVGKYQHRTRRTPLGRIEPYDFHLRFSVLFDLTPEELDDVIIHEMIHYHIAYHQLHDTAPHGLIFCKMMNDINQTFGRNISISHKLSPEKVSAVKQLRQTVHVIAALRLATGGAGVKVLPRSRPRIEAYCKRMLTHPEVEAIRLYISDDPFFNKYPTSSTLSAYEIEKKELEAHLQKASPLKLQFSEA